jgi:hypothetical protein
VGANAGTTNRRTAFVLCSLLALTAWVAVAISTVEQKMNAVTEIRDSFDISAVQIQQLNGTVASHALAALLIGRAATIPLLIVAVSALVNASARDEDERVVEYPESDGSI